MILVYRIDDPELTFAGLLRTRLGQSKGMVCDLAAACAGVSQYIADSERHTVAWCFREPHVATTAQLGRRKIKEDRRTMQSVLSEVHQAI